MFGAAFVVDGGLHHGVHGVAIIGDCQSLETLVVVAAALGVGGNHLAVWVVTWRGVGGEADGVVAAGDDGLWRTDGKLHLPVSTKFIDVWPILIADEKRAVSVQDESLAVDRDSLASWAWAAKTITLVCGDREIGKAAVCDASCGIGVKARGRFSIWPAEQNGIEILKLQIRPGGVFNSRIWRKGQSYGELVDAILLIQRSFRVPSPFVSHE